MKAVYHSCVAQSWTCGLIFNFPFCRHLRFGGMTFMETSVADMKAFVGAALSDSHALSREDRDNLHKLLIRAIQGYREDVRRYKKGDIHLWHLDSLYRNLGLTNRLPYRDTAPLDLKTRLRGAVANVMRSPLINILPAEVPENVTSNPYWYSEIEAIGRSGVKCILPPESMALHYIFGKGGISVTVNANPKHPCYEREEMFVVELEACLKFVLDLLSVN